MAAMARSAPLQWPKEDTLLSSFQADAELVEVNSPIFTPSQHDSQAAEGGRGYRSYTRVCPEFEIRMFHKAAWNPQAGPLHLLGAVYFSKATAGAPRCVAGGAVATALDCICADMAMRRTGWEAMYVTRSLSLHFLRLVLLDSVCRFDCCTKAEEHGRCTVHCSLSAASSVLTRCTCITSSAGPLPQSMVERLGAPRAPPPLVMPVPADDEGWWPAAARELAARMVREDPRLQPRNDHARHFPEEHTAAHAGQTLWETSTGTSPHWDVTCQGAAAQALAGSAPKVVWQLFWHGGTGSGPSVVGVVIFTANAQGPPSRAQGGAVATTLDWAAALVCNRQIGFLPQWINVNLHVEYRRPVPLGEPVLLAARLTKRDVLFAQAEAVLLTAAAWPSRSESLWDADYHGLLARAWADCKRARPSSVGLEEAISYEEAIERFSGAGSLAQRAKL